MGKIRSAWEIALEKTEGMEIDHDKIKRSTEIDKIRRTAGQYITAEENDADEEQLKKKLSAFDPALVREALENTIMNSMVLPQDESAVDEKTKRIRTLLTIAFPSEDILSYYDQISQHMAQYPKNKEDLISRLKEQLEPMLRQKEEAMREKYGQSVHLTLDNDKESLETIKNYIDRLNSQYQETLDNAKETMRQLLEQYR